MSTGDPPNFVIHDPDLLRRLMQRTGDGTSVTVRELADAAGCSPAAVGHLLTGYRTGLSLALASGIANRIGVDLLVLFTPTGRTVPGLQAVPDPMAVPA